MSDPWAEPPDEDEDEESPSETAIRVSLEEANRQHRIEVQRYQQQSEKLVSPSKKREKEPMCRQYHVAVFVLEDAEVIATATVANARDQVWQRYGNVDGRFRVTRAEASGKVRWEDEDGDELEVDQLVFVCDYVAKGANADDPKKKIRRVLEATGISVLAVTATETARLRIELPTAVAEDLPSSSELVRRANLG